MNHTLYRLSCLPATLGAVALLGAPVRADLTMDITPTSALPGGSGAFDVTLADVSGSFNVGGFTFELSVPGGSGVTFTNASMSTGGTYIFAGNSFDTANSLPFSLNSFPTTDVAASDAANTGGTPMIAGDVYDLGHIDYSVAPGTSQGTVPVTIVGPGNNTSLSDPSANPISFTAASPTIVVASSVPEPGTAGITAAFALAGTGLLRRRRQSARS